MNPAQPLVLLLEDDPDTSSLYQSVLRREGMRVVRFDTGHKAKNWLAEPQNKPDLMIIDVRLPDGSGVEVCRHICQCSGKTMATPVLMLSAHCDPRLPEACRQAGAMEFLDKLVDLDQFRKTVHRLLNFRCASNFVA